MSALTDGCREQRLRLIEIGKASIVKTHRNAGLRDCVVLVLDIHDPDARAVAKALGQAGVDAAHEMAVREKRFLCCYLAIDRGLAIKMLKNGAPQLASVAPRPITGGRICVVALSAGGAYVGVVKPRRRSQ